MPFSLEALKHPSSARLFSGQLISQVCDKMMTVGLVWVFLHDYSAGVIPWFLAVSALPHLLLAGKSGGWVSSIGPLKTAIRTDAFRGAVFLALAAAWPWVRGPLELPALFAASFVSNLAGALFNPAILSLPISLTADVGMLQQLTALIDSCFSFGTVLGPMASALLFPWIGLKGLFVFNGASYLLAAWLESGIVVIDSRDHGRPAGRPVAGSAGPKSAGWLEILRRDRLLMTMLGGFLAINLFLAPVTVFLPLFVKEVYRGGLSTLAGLETALGIGTILGGVFLSIVRLDTGVGRKILAGMACVAAGYLSFSLSGSVLWGALSLGGLGFFLSTVNVFSLNLFQMRPTPSEVPAVMSLVNLISVASLPFSMTLVSFCIGHVEIRRLALGCACILSVITLGVATSRELRTL